MASGTDSQGNSGHAAIDRFAAMMIERMQHMKDTGWKQGWIGGASGYAGLPHPLYNLRESYKLLLI